MTISEDDLRGLSAAEREALTSIDENDEDVQREIHGNAGAAADAAGAAAGAGAGDDDAGGETTKEEDAAAAAAALAAGEAGKGADTGKTEGEGAGAAQDEEQGADVLDDAPPPRVAPADIAEQRTALNAREDESMQKLLDGEITQEEHAKTKNEVRASLEALLLAEATDRATDQIRQDQMMKIFKADLAETIKLGKAAGLAYDTPELGPTFDRTLRMFSKELSEQGINDSPGNLANSKQALAETHAFMMRRHGKTATAPAPAAAPAAAAPAPKKEGRPPVDRSQLGVTLAAVPVAADARISGGEFAHLDAITEPAALERELAKLTPEQQERYLGA